MKFMATLFSIFVVIGAVGVGIFCQINSMSLSFATLGIAPWVTGVGIAIAVSFVLLGGVRRFARLAAAVIPLMAILYLGGALFILATHSGAILPAFATMFKSAFGFSSVAGGALGFGAMQMITTGVGRALFATDVGTGYVPILQAGARSKHHVIDGAVALVAPLLVMIVCTITALVLIVTGAFQTGLQSTPMVVHAFQMGVGKVVGSAIVNSALLLFGYTTILAWACCFEKGIGFLFGCRFVKYFRLLFIALIPISALFSINFVWMFADVALALMTLVNLVGIFGLSREVVSESSAFFSPEKEISL